MTNSQTGKYKTRHALSAAHCSIRPNSHYAYLGTRRRFDYRASIIASIEAVEIPPDYDPSKDYANDVHDISLVVLDENLGTLELKYTYGIMPIRVIWNADVLLNGQKLLAHGAGNISPSPYLDFPEFIQKGRFYKMDRALCAEHFRQVAPDNLLCVIGEDMAALCTGDSGGPILLYTTSRYGNKISYLVGTVVGAPRPTILNCMPGVPTASVKLSRHKRWIEEVVDIHTRWDEETSLFDTL